MVLYFRLKRRSFSFGGQNKHPTCRFFLNLRSPTQGVDVVIACFCLVSTEILGERYMRFFIRQFEYEPIN